MRGRTARRVRRALIVAAFLVGPLAVLLSWQLSGRSSSRQDTSRPPPVQAIHAEDLQRRTIYRSPQRPGYTSWVGAWTMPDHALMAAFVQATGPVDPRKRQLSPQRVVDAFGVPRWDPRSDFWGLHLAVEYLRSADGGRTWNLFRSDAFKAPRPHGYAPQATIALHDGTIVRRVNGDDLRFDPTVPHTAYLQRLAPHADHWSAPQVLMDPARFTYQITRLRYLRDGRLIATGNSWSTPADTPLSERSKIPSTFLLMVSADDGRTWRNALTIPADTGYLPGLEWDTAELPNGDLMAVMRTLESPGRPVEVRKQALLRKQGAGWTLTDLKAAPFPHSGHPELLATREGPILHIATTGIDYTADGRTWKPLRFSPSRPYTSGYYPRAVQTEDGVIHVFSHVGADDDYGERDQSILMDTFRLRAG